MSETVRVILDGTYSPDDYFEEPQKWEYDRYSASIQNGNIEIIIKNPDLLPDQQEQLKIESEIRQHFKIHQFLTGKPFDFKGLGMVREREGQRDIWASFDGGKITLEAGFVDISIQDADGNIISDSKAERLEDHKNFHELSRKHQNDQLLKKLVASYVSALEDPKNLLIHLYEITESLEKSFNDRRQACASLNISRHDWKEIRTLANDGSLQEGRHRGAKILLRPISEEESQNPKK